MVAAVVAAATALLPAAAEAGWVRDTIASSGKRTFSQPSVGFDAHGQAIAAWIWDFGYGYALRGPDGRWRPPANLTTARVVRVAAYGGHSGGAIVLGRINRGELGDPDATTELGIRRFENGRIGSERALDPGHSATVDGAFAAIDRSGRMLVAWTRADPRDGGVYARDVSAAGELGPIRRLEARGRVAGVALNDRGAALVAWEETDETLRARARARAGASFADRDELGPFATEYSNDGGACCGEVSVALSQDGRALAAWEWSPTEDIGPDSGSQISTEIYVAAAASGRPFARAVRVQTDELLSDSGVAVAFTRRGDGLAMWAAEPIAYAPLRGTGLGPRRTVGGGSDPVLAAGASSFIAAWGEYGRNAGLRTARISGGGGLLGATEPLAGQPGRDAFGFADPAIAIDPRTARPTVLWRGPNRSTGGSSLLSAERR